MIAAPPPHRPGPLPPLYARWMGELLQRPLPAETAATCDDCAMLPPPGGAAPRGLFFRADTKCCTYLPALPNFLVGRILDDASAAAGKGRSTVEARIAAGVGVTPLGLEPAPVPALLYRAGAPEAFGRSRNLRCPHYLDEAGGRCGIWAHRNGVCATWFCKYSRGAAGQRLWKTLDLLLAVAERELARWCVLRLDLGAEPLARLFPHGTDRGAGEVLDGPRIDGTVDPAAYRGLWGAWQGRERELYRESARLVGALAWAEVRAIAGTKLQVFERVLADALHRLDAAALPERLAMGAFQVIGSDAGRVRAVGYSGLDPVELPRVLLDALARFDGRQTADALREIERELGIRIAEDLLLRLADVGLLEPVE